MSFFLFSFISGAAFLLSFLLFFHPYQQNIVANRWLGFFVFIIGCAFVSTYMLHADPAFSSNLLLKSLISLQFLSGACLYISIQYFGNPMKKLGPTAVWHLVPFLVYCTAEFSGNTGKETLSVYPLFHINADLSFLVRDILPFLLLCYLVGSYRLLKKHQANLKQISSSIETIQLAWLEQFLFILLLVVLIWINDALFELPFLTQATTYLYAGAVFFLAWFAIRQKAVFVFKDSEIREIAEVLELPIADPPAAAAPDSASATGKSKRLDKERMAELAAELTRLLEKDKIYLDNELNLPTLAAKLGISIHEASFLINETAGDNFYNLVNRYRVEEAKRLLASPRLAELSILGIAFAAGFNSKTAFNTAFRKWAGVSPSAYVKSLENRPETGAAG